MKILKTPAVLAIDQGTTGTTCLVVGQNGEIISRAYSEFTQYFPRPGWVEHDPIEIWTITQKMAQSAIKGASNAEIQGVGITNQRETVVFWSKETLEPLHRAIVWQDRRTIDICSELKGKGYESKVKSKTGLVLDPYFSATKIMWLFRERPDLRILAEAGELAIGTIDSWLISRLTGGAAHVTDPTNASRTLLYNLEEGIWDPWLLEIMEIPETALPEIRPSSGFFGSVLSETIGVEAPICGVAGDQQAALYGQGCWSPGLAKNTYGTGAFLLMNTGEKPIISRHGLLTTAACDSRGNLCYALEGSIFVAGAAIQWLRDALGIIEDASVSGTMAASLDSNDGVYFVPAFVGLGAPRWSPNSRGAILGITGGTQREHLVRAALEAMAYGTVEVLKAMEQDSLTSIKELRVDGGASMNNWLMEFQSSLLDVPVRRPQVVETTAFGAAGLAGIYAGVWADGEEFIACQGDPDRFSVSLDEDKRNKLIENWTRAVEAVETFS
mgnify:CR=1 FL=1